MCETNWTNLRTFSRKRFDVELSYAEDEFADISWMDETTKNDWANGDLGVFVFRVAVYLDGRKIAEDTLSESAYYDPRDFESGHRDPDPMQRNCSFMRAQRGDNVVICTYFPGMVSAAIAQARSVLTNVPKMRKHVTANSC